MGEMEHRPMNHAFLRPDEITVPDRDSMTRSRRALNYCAPSARIGLELIKEYLKLCLSVLRINTPRTLGVDDATRASALIRPLPDNLACDDTGLRISAMSVQARLGNHWHFLYKFPFPIRRISQDTLNPSRKCRIRKSDDLNADGVHGPGAVISSGRIGALRV